MKLFVIIVVISLWRGNMGQSSWASWSNNNSPDSSTSGKNYYMDSSTDCGGKFLLNNPTMLYGHRSGTGVGTAPPLTCHITFWTDDIRTKRKFVIQVENAAIRSTGAKFYIYNGDVGSNQKLMSFTADQNTQNIPLLQTSGGFVTFTLIRTTEDDKDYSISVKITPMQGDMDPTKECEGGEGPGCVYFYNELPVTKEVIIGIVGGIFGLIIIIIIPLIVICCYRKQRGVTRRWDEFKLGQGNTAADIAGSRSSIKPQKEPWTSQSSKQFASIKRSPNMPRAKMSRYSEDDDSVFDDVPNYPPAPPPYTRFERRDQMDSRDRRDRNDSRYDSRERLDRGRRDRDRREREDRDRREREERERDERERRERNRERDRFSRRPNHFDREKRSLSSEPDSDTSFVQADDDHPQENFVERIIEPRVKPKPKVKTKIVKEEDVYDVLEENISEPAKSNQGIQCEQSEEEEDNESNTETTDTESTESETDSEEEKPDPKAALYAKPNKGKSKSNGGAVPQPQIAAYPGHGPPMMQPAFPRGVVPNTMVGVPPPPPHMSAYPPPGVVVRPVHPQSQPYFAPRAYNQPPVMRPVGMVPGQPGQNQFRPVKTGYPQGTVPPQQQSHPSHPKTIKPQDPPVYSYLVQRGYTPLEPGRNSPNSSSTGMSHNSDVAYHTEESDVGPNLQSGVDLMKRSTTTTV